MFLTEQHEIALAENIEAMTRRMEDEGGIICYWHCFDAMLAVIHR